MQDWDEHIRKVMLDAEEAVPSRVWDAVSAELDKAAAPKVVPFWWRVARIAVPAAAAVALGVFLALPRSGQAGPDRFDVVIARAEPALQVPGLVSPRDIVLKDRLLADASASVRVQEEGTGSLSGQEASAPETSAPETDAAGSVKPSSVPDRSSGSSYASDEAAFNALAYEEMNRSRGRKFDFMAGGNIQTNGNPSSTRTSYMRSSPKPQTGIVEGTNRYYGIPVTIGVGFGYRFAPRWSVSTGLTYTSLSRTFTGRFVEIDAVSGTEVRSVSGEVDNVQQYIGIPLNLRYHLMDGERIRCYSFVGGTVERCLSDKYRIQATENLLWSKPIRGVQVSAALGLGVEFAVTPHLGIYADPSIRYWFPCRQSKSIRTQQPLMAGMEVGLRFGW